MKRKTNQRGFAIAQVLVAIGLMGALGGVSYMYNQNQKTGFERNLIMSATNVLDSSKIGLVNDIRAGLAISLSVTDNTVKSPKATLSDMGVNTAVGADGADGAITPVAGYIRYRDGFKVPNDSSSPKVDPWGTEILYCPFNNGNGMDGSNNGNGITNPTNGYATALLSANFTTAGTKYLEGEKLQKESSIVFAIISAGVDKTFQTSCLDIANKDGGENPYPLRKGDDGVRVVSVLDVKKGVGGTKFYGDPINVATDLANVVAEHNELRMVSSTGVVYKYDQNTITPVIASSVKSGGWLPLTSPRINTFKGDGTEDCAEFGTGATSTTATGELLVCTP